MTKHIKITTFKYADEAWQEGVTLNKYYEVANESDSRYSFINDNNMLRSAHKDFPMYQITERHPHAELMVTAAEIAKNRYDWWEEFDWRLNKEHEWLPMAEDSFYEKYDYRLKPRTIKIGNREINAPEREPLKEAEIYYTPQFDGSLQTWHRWNNSGYDQYLLKNRLIFLTKEDAIAAAEAMIALLSGE